jgi:cytochrome c
MRPSRLPAGVALISLCGAAAAGDVERGEVIFQKCYACHSVVPGEAGLTGPNLSGVVGRAVASVPGFEYSRALEALPARGYGTWTRATLDAFLASPEEFAPGTAMTFVGMPDPVERADVIAYLARTGIGSGKE